jgi:hypothetical protein
MSTVVDLNDFGASEDALPIWEVTIGDYRFQLFPDNQAFVFKGEAKVPTYVVTHGACNCPAGMYRGSCKHMNAIKYLGDSADNELCDDDLELESSDDSDDLLSNLLDV